MGQRLHQKPNIPLLEWIAAAIGSVLVGGTMMFLAWQGWHRDESPPEVAVRVLEVQAQRNGYVATVQARNSGGQTAAEVKVEGELRRGGTAVETSELTFSYLPPDSARDGGLFFRNDPGAHELVLRAEGYEKP